MNSGPPPTWREHWFEHDQLLHLAGATSDVAVYFDADVNDDAARWLLPYLDEAWQYTKQTFGEVGPDPLLSSIFHQVRCRRHPSSHLPEPHNRNVTDCVLAYTGVATAALRDGHARDLPSLWREQRRVGRWVF
jgi:hypothetical protein